MTGTPTLPRLNLLGGFRLTSAAGTELTLSSRKGKALLAVLALAPGLSATRARLRSLLWSDRSEEQASASLRQLLVILRKELAPLGSGVMRVREDSVGLDPDSLDVDVARFTASEAAGDAAQAVASYSGHLLDGFDLGDQAFEEWLGAERQDFRARAIAVFDLCVGELAGEARVAAAQRLIALDPLREASHRALIAAYLASGEPVLARKQFEACKALLARELGVTPAAETVALLTERPAATLHAKPSVAVLQFANLSDDPAQRYFSDGITADIVTELSRFHQLLVRAVKGKHDSDALAVGRELNVHYVAEGSVRRFGQRIRISVQLHDVETGQNRWAERFDTDEKDLFEVQDKIARSIAAQLAGRLTLAGIEKAARKPPTSLVAYELYLRGHALPLGVPEAEMEAQRLFKKAIEVDPGYARAYASLGSHYIAEWCRDPDAESTLLDQALALTKKAVALDDQDDYCHAMLGRTHMFRRDHQLAVFHYQKALTINPNSPFLLAGVGILYGFRGEPDRGLAYFREALELDPHFDPTWYWRNRAVVHFIAREYREAIEAFRRSPIFPDWVEAYLAASYAHLGELEEAKKHTAAALRQTPHLTIQRLLTCDPYRRPEDAKHFEEGLRKAAFADF